jgi:hypothetical protein
VSGIVAGVAVAGMGAGYPATRANLLSGAAWLPSTQVGQLTLLDGASVEVAAQVRVAPSGTGLDVVQQGATAYALDRAAGAIRRVDGATFEVSPPATPIPGSGGHLQAFAGPDTLYAVDTGHGVLATADAHTLAVRSGPVPLATQLTPQAATLDGAGRLWLVDAATGDLNWVDHGQRHSRRAATRPGAGLLALADGTPVLVDTARRTAAVLDPATGASQHVTDLDLRPDDRIQVTGSPHARRLYVVATRGVVSICELTAPNCRAAVPLGTEGGDPGPAVEAGDRIFVPDYRTGQVSVIDLRQPRVLAHPSVLSPPARFQLFARDGVVFFNDPDSERAGVLRLDGGVRPVAKYDPGNPDRGLSTKAGPETSPSPTGPAPPAPPPPGQPPADPATPPSTPSTPSTPGGPGGPGGLPRLAITVSTGRPFVGEQVRLAVATDRNPAPTRAHWSFGDGATADGIQADHTWTAAQTYQVSVEATFPDGRTAVASQPIQVLPPSVAALAVLVTGPGTVSSQPAGIACPPDCAHEFPPGTPVTLTANPGSGSRLTGWGGACAGTAPSCQVTLGTGRTDVSADFAAVARPTLTVQVPGGHGTVSGPGIACPPTCSAAFDPGQAVILTAAPAPEFKLNGWGGACGGTGGCTVVMSGNKGVSAAFADLAAPEDCFSYNPDQMHFGPVGSTWELRTGFNGGSLLAAVDTIEQVQNAQNVARGFNTRCQVTGAGGTMHYWKGGAGRAGSVSPESCFSYNPGTLRVTQESPTKWHLTDGTVTFGGFFDSEAKAVRGKRVAQQWHQECIIGNSHFVLYWR